MLTLELIEGETLKLGLIELETLGDILALTLGLTLKLGEIDADTDLLTEGDTDLLTLRLGLIDLDTDLLTDDDAVIISPWVCQHQHMPALSSVFLQCCINFQNALKELVPLCILDQWF